MSETMKALHKEAAKCAEEIKKYKSVHVVSHKIGRASCRERV